MQRQPDIICTVIFSVLFAAYALVNIVPTKRTYEKKDFIELY